MMAPCCDLPGDWFQFYRIMLIIIGKYYETSMSLICNALKGMEKTVLVKTYF